MAQPIPLSDVARLASPTDNVAVATRRLEPGLTISFNQHTFTLDFTVLEGHRFAVRPIGQGEALLSWGLPFGFASREIQAGQYVANQSILETLKARSISVKLPEQANFVDAIKPYELDETHFKPAQQLPLYGYEQYFEGFVREGRGTGTRNYIVLLATSSLTGSFVRQLEARLKDGLSGYKNIDGVVAVAHTEGGTRAKPNNYELVLRTLAGFVVHPNVAAVLCVDMGHEAINNAALKAYLQQNQYPLDKVLHRFYSLNQNFAQSLTEAETIVRRWLEPANQHQRQHVSASQLKLGLQCGGSDAFSGISANPLLAWVAKELVCYGGSANLAETDELIGAESYVLQKVRSLEVAQKFLATIERFKTRVAWHGTTAEGNPSGGNKLRGLYNISLKSIGAANKKHPQTRLDEVIEYGEPMTAGGYYFMDSPGNDLESIAGQVASGCNMIFFTTGNGSITNFPFVPTIKIVTTTERFKLLEKDMDVNAGAYLDGISMEALGQQTLELMLKVASGQKSVGEQAGHAQVQLWRNWQQTDSTHLAQLLNPIEPSGQPIRIACLAVPNLLQQFGPFASDQLALILPTSLCSGQIAAMIAKGLNEKQLGRDKGLSRFVSLAHTEGCGVSGGRTATLQTRTLLNYLRHPAVKHALLLEHGCEMTHNDHMRQILQTLGIPAAQFGFASIQLDGGIERVTQKVESWFKQEIERFNAPRKTVLGLGAARVGVQVSAPVSETISRQIAAFIRTIAGAGGTVVVPESILDCGMAEYLEAIDPLTPTLAFGQFAEAPGFHIMQSPTSHWVETLTGLGATGVEVVLAHTSDHPLQTHPFIPVVQVCSDEALYQRHADSLDLLLSTSTSEIDLLQAVASVLSRAHSPRLRHNTDFQMTRGLLGVSM